LTVEHYGSRRTSKTSPPVTDAQSSADGDIKLFQSLAILEHLDEKYPGPPLLPADPLAIPAFADAHPSKQPAPVKAENAKGMHRFGEWAVLSLGFSDSINGCGNASRTSAGRTTTGSSL
jgi:hypothetical protein